jgi:hypothetical protein
MERKKNDSDFLIPENLLSAKRRRALRILISFNSKNRNNSQSLINKENFNGNNINNYDPILDKSKDLNRDKKNLMKFKFFLWPNYRLEDLACMNRYWFGTNNGSRFSMIRIDTPR